MFKFFSPTNTNDGQMSVQLSKIYMELEAIEADRAPARAGQILAGLGFSPESQNRPTK